MELLKPIAFLRNSLPLLTIAFSGASLLIFGLGDWQLYITFAGLFLQILLFVTHYRYPVKENPKVRYYWQGASILLVVVITGLLMVKKQRIEESFRGPIKKAERAR